MIEFEIFQRTTLFGRRWFYRIKDAGNHRKIGGGGEGYHNHADVRKVVEKIRGAAASAKVRIVDQ